MKKIFLSFCFLISFASCIEPKTQPRPTPIVVDTDKCYLAEVKLKELHCISDGAFTKKGKSFSQVCEETQEAGVFMNPRCLSTITSCDQVDVCTGSK